MRLMSTEPAAVSRQVYFICEIRVIRPHDSRSSVFEALDPDSFRPCFSCLPKEIFIAGDAGSVVKKMHISRVDVFQASATSTSEPSLLCFHRQGYPLCTIHLKKRTINIYYMQFYYTIYVRRLISKLLTKIKSMTVKSTSKGIYERYRVQHSFT